MCQPQGLEMYSISYLVNQPTDPRLLDDSAHSISIYSLNKHLKVDAKNIMTSFYRIVLFVKSRILNGKMKKRYSTYCRIWLCSLEPHFTHL